MPKRVEEINTAAVLADRREEVVTRCVTLLADNHHATLTGQLGQAFDAGAEAERGRVVAYIHRAPDGTETVFAPEEIFILREGAE